MNEGSSLSMVSSVGSCNTVNRYAQNWVRLRESWKRKLEAPPPVDSDHRLVSSPQRHRLESERAGAHWHLETHSATPSHSLAMAGISPSPHPPSFLTDALPKLHSTQPTQASSGMVSSHLHAVARHLETDSTRSCSWKDLVGLCRTPRYAWILATARDGH